MPTELECFITSLYNPKILLHHEIRQYIKSYVIILEKIDNNHNDNLHATKQGHVLDNLNYQAFKSFRTHKKYLNIYILIKKLYNEDINELIKIYNKTENDYKIYLCEMNKFYIQNGEI